MIPSLDQGHRTGKIYFTFPSLMAVLNWLVGLENLLLGKRFLIPFDTSLVLCPRSNELITNCSSPKGQGEECPCLPSQVLPV